MKSQDVEVKVPIWLYQCFDENEDPSLYKPSILQNPSYSQFLQLLLSSLLEDVFDSFWHL